MKVDQKDAQGAVFVAEEAYEKHVIQTCEGADERQVRSDIAGLSYFGHCIGWLALRIAGRAATLEYQTKRPDAVRLATLMAESIDSELDGEASAVVRAAAILAAMERKA